MSSLKKKIHVILKNKNNNNNSAQIWGIRLNEFFFLTIQTNPHMKALYILAKDKKICFNKKIYSISFSIFKLCLVTISKKIETIEIEIHLIVKLEIKIEFYLVSKTILNHFSIHLKRRDIKEEYKTKLIFFLGVYL